LVNTFFCVEHQKEVIVNSLPSGDQIKQILIHEAFDSSIVVSDDKLQCKYYPWYTSLRLISYVLVPIVAQ